MRCHDAFADIDSSLKPLERLECKTETRDRRNPNLLRRLFTRERPPAALATCSEPARRPRLPDSKNCTLLAASCQDDYQPTYDLDYNHTGTMDMSGKPSLPANGCGRGQP